MRRECYDTISGPRTSRGCLLIVESKHAETESALLHKHASNVSSKSTREKSKQSINRPALVVGVSVLSPHRQPVLCHCPLVNLRDSSEVQLPRYFVDTRNVAPRLHQRFSKTIFFPTRPLPKRPGRRKHHALLLRFKPCQSRCRSGSGNAAESPSSVNPTDQTFRDSPTLPVVGLIGN